MIPKFRWQGYCEWCREWVDVQNTTERGHPVMVAVHTQYVTHDMASDACEPEMEGQIYSEEPEWDYCGEILRFRYVK